MMIEMKFSLISVKDCLNGLRRAKVSIAQLDTDVLVTLRTLKYEQMILFVMQELELLKSQN